MRCLFRAHGKGNIQFLRFDVALRALLGSYAVRIGWAGTIFARQHIRLRELALRTGELPHVTLNLLVGDHPAMIRPTPNQVSWGMISSRKAAIQAYKERKAARGIFAVRCLATGTVWVDHAMDLAAAEKRTAFVLPLGDRFLDQEIFVEFRAHGAESFRYEILETFDDDLSPLAIRDLLKERKLHWLGQLNARRLSPA